MKVGRAALATDSTTEEAAPVAASTTLLADAEADASASLMTDWAPWSPWAWTAPARRAVERSAAALKRMVDEYSCQPRNGDAMLTRRWQCNAM